MRLEVKARAWRVLMTDVAELRLPTFLRGGSEGVLRLCELAGAAWSRDWVSGGAVTPPPLSPVSAGDVLCVDDGALETREGGEVWHLWLGDRIRFEAWSKMGEQYRRFFEEALRGFEMQNLWWTLIEAACEAPPNSSTRVAARIEMLLRNSVVLARFRYATSEGVVSFVRFVELRFAHVVDVWDPDGEGDAIERNPARGGADGLRF
ncbi:MAG: hypothetical protein QM767_14480 [Anaeromyxobacter sp.]